jgi:hypothetical protein
MTNKYREPLELTDQEMEYRDHLIEELKARTGASIVNIVAYKENQLISPYTVSPEQIILECRVGNQVSKIIISPEMVGMGNRQLYYSFREIVNRMMDNLIKAGAQAL